MPDTTSAAGATPAAGTITVSAPGKLNLGLRVVGRRDDGYHLLESRFVPLELSDTIEIDFSDLGRDRESADLRIDFEIEAHETLPGSSTLGPSERNLAVRAARAFCEAGRLSGTLQIRVIKAVPIGAGLGGGSSDAGSVLRALDTRFSGAVAPDALTAMALRLGADVPFFLSPEPSLVRGIGEEISPLQGQPPLSVVLVNPGVSLATAEVFAAFDEQHPALTLDATRSTMRALRGPGADPEQFTNDLEPFATTLCPLVGELQEQLRKVGAQSTAMSGSGATVYGVFSNDHEARSALEQAGFQAPIWACATSTLGELGEPKA